MTLVSDIVTSALRKIRVVDSDSVPSAAEMRDGISAMNRMVMRWEADGIALGYSQVSASTDTLPAPIESENAIIYNLAIVLADEFGIGPSPSLATLGAEYKAALMRDMLNVAPLRARAFMPSSEGSVGNYDIYTDSYR